MTRQPTYKRHLGRRAFIRAFAGSALSVATTGASLTACGDTRHAPQEHAATSTVLARAPSGEPQPQVDAQPLPPPNLTGALSLEEALAARRSVRSYGSQALTWQEIGQLLWAAQGVTLDRGPSRPGLRSAPSAGALYPLETYVVTGEGAYRYLPDDHAVRAAPRLGLRRALWEAGLEQDGIREAPAVFLLAAVFERTAERYGARAARYVHLEAGHAAENLLLQAVALGLAGVVIGAFYDQQVQAALSLPQEHEPLYLIPVGHPKE